MHNHAPRNYKCPLCLLLGGMDDPVFSTQADIVYQDETVTILISSHHWTHHSGNVIIIPNRHYENIYDLPDGIGAKIYAATRRVAQAMKQAYGCEGISTRQHNEPAGNQDVFHFHMHVFPRFMGDQLYGAEKTYTPPEERLDNARNLRSALGGLSFKPDDE